MRKLLVIILWGLLVGLPVRAAENSFVLSPGQGNFSVGENVSVDFLINSDQAVNAARARFLFPNDLLELVSIDRQNSLFSLWPQEPTVQGGRIDFEGGLPDPGFSGENGRLFRMNFKVLQPGTARLTFISGSLHANDGRGTNILSKMTGATYTLLPSGSTPAELGIGLPPAPQISSSVFTDQSSWYKQNSGDIAWTVPVGISETYYAFDRQPDTLPTELHQSTSSRVLLSDVDDGIWYAHVRFRNANGLGPVSHYRVMIDTIAPEAYTIEVKVLPQSDSAVIFFQAVDSGSGIDYYEVRVDGGQVNKNTNGYIDVADLELGVHHVAITAYDRAGNSRFSESSIELTRLSAAVVPYIKVFLPGAVSMTMLLYAYYIIIGLLLLLLLWALFYWYRRREAKEEGDFRQEVGELTATVDYGFTTLRQDILAQIDEMWKKQKTLGLTDAEMKKLKKLEMDLDIIEVYVRRELQDVVDFKKKKK